MDTRHTCMFNLNYNFTATYLMTVAVYQDVQYMYIILSMHVHNLQSHPELSAAVSGSSLEEQLSSLFWTLPKYSDSQLRSCLLFSEWTTTIIINFDIFQFQIFKSHSDPCPSLYSTSLHTTVSDFPHYKPVLQTSKSQFGSFKTELQIHSGKQS